MPEPTEVRSMFARIAGRYDFLNHVLSMGVDRSWRRRVVERAGAVEGQPVIDLCCGTGDLAVRFARAGARVFALDFTREMLVHGLPKRKGLPGEILYAHADALRIPVEAGSSAVCTVAFGIRNVADRRACMREMRRVLRPGGLAMILEFARPAPGLFGSAYRFYFQRILPRIGGVISGDFAAYRYLPETVMAWPSPDELRAEMLEEGFDTCDYELLARGIACLHVGRVS